MQFVLNKLGVSNYQFSIHAQKAQAYNPFSQVPQPLSSTSKISKIRGVDCSLIAEEYPEERPNIFWPSPTSFMSMLS